MDEPLDFSFPELPDEPPSLEPEPTPGPGSDARAVALGMAVSSVLLAIASLGLSVPQEALVAVPAAAGTLVWAGHVWRRR